MRRYKSKLTVLITCVMSVHSLVGCCSVKDAGVVGWLLRNEDVLVARLLMCCEGYSESQVLNFGRKQ